VHRFNKAQQDAFLPHVESGLFTFIGATTENPSFEVNSALLSRASVHVLKSPFGRARVRELVRPRLPQALLARNGPRRRASADRLRRRRCAPHAEREPGAGDAAAGGRVASARSSSEQVLGKMLRRFDKGGDAFYDQISALHKSVRGSDPDAALYWFVRMLDGGADPRYLARRMMRMASEDIGLADPRALRMALDAAETYERLGSPRASWRWPRP
jgi:putative ATPase